MKEFRSLEIEELRGQLAKIYMQIGDLDFRIMQSDASEEIYSRPALHIARERIAEAAKLLRGVYDAIEDYELQHGEES